MNITTILVGIGSYLLDRFREVRRLWEPHVFGVEVTQAIQHYRAADHLHDPNDRGADNSIRLVAYKPTWVRVYVRNGLLNIATQVSASLDLERRRLGLLWDPVTTLPVQPPGTLSTATTTSYATERGNVASTLNFVIPAEHFHGTLRLRIRLTDSGGVQLDVVQRIIDASLWQSLRIRAILVAYNGPSSFATTPPPGNLQLPAPTLADLQATAALALRAMPVAATGVFASAGTLTWNLPLDDPRSCPGCCSANWGQLLSALSNQRTNDGNRADVVYYGLLPTGIPLNVPGCGQGGLGSAAAGNQGTLFHEIGHGYGFAHTPCGNTGTPDPAYPSYEPYPSASIGEYGLDISNGNVLSPQSTFDYMSYCGPQWISLYQYKRLILHPRLDPRWLSDQPWWEDYLERWPPWWKWPLPDPPPFDIWKGIAMLPAPIISITGIVHGPGEIRVSTVARVSAAGLPPGEQSGLTALLLDQRGETLGRGALYRLRNHGDCGCGGEGGGEGLFPYNFQAFIADVAPGAALLIRDAAGQEIWRRDAPTHPPAIDGLGADLADDGQLQLAWRQDVAGDAFEVWLQWSNDGGRSWNGLATGITGTRAQLGIEGLPAGPVWLRVLLHDGFQTAVSEAIEIELPQRPPGAVILHPRDGQTLLAGATLQLWGAALAPGGEPLDPEASRWWLDDQEVGRGPSLWLTAPPPGEHRVTLVAEGPGGESRTAVGFVSVDAVGPKAR